MKVRLLLLATAWVTFINCACGADFTPIILDTRAGDDFAWLYNAGLRPKEDVTPNTAVSVQEHIHLVLPDGSALSLPSERIDIQVGRSGGMKAMKFVLVDREMDDIRKIYATFVQAVGPSKREPFEKFVAETQAGKRGYIDSIWANRKISSVVLSWEILPRGSTGIRPFGPRVHISWISRDREPLPEELKPPPGFEQFPLTQKWYSAKIPALPAAFRALPQYFPPGTPLPQLKSASAVSDAKSSRQDDIGIASIQSTSERSTASSKAAAPKNKQTDNPDSLSRFAAEIAILIGIILSAGIFFLFRRGHLRS